MRMRLGPGPVFVYESIAATRRWQFYATRSLAVILLLAGILLTWLILQGRAGQWSGTVRLRDLAKLGEYFYYGISTVQLILVLLVAPAATAGAICLDRARGNLTHMLVTDLSDAEIVLGKLSARLLPVLALVAGAMPVLAMAGLLGGIIIEAIVLLALVTLACAVLGCTLALAVSVRASKTHEVLMAVYAIEALWVMGPLILELLDIRRMSVWYVGINPFVIAWTPYAWPNTMDLTWIAEVLGALMAIACGLTAYAMLRLRKKLVGGIGHRVGVWLDGPRRWIASVARWWPRPSLDRNPVLWREWHRARPSRLARFVWGAFFAFSIVGTTVGLVDVAENYDRGRQFLMTVGGLEATFGLLLLSLTVPTVLAEERVRGGLDVLMTTPLSTDQIVMAKWRGAFRIVPALVFLPAIGAVILAIVAPEFTPVVLPAGSKPTPIDLVDRIAYATLPVGLMLAQGAAIVSVGLALATWTRRVGRAVAASVTAYAFFAFIWPILCELIGELLMVAGLLDRGDRLLADFVASLLATLCPLGSQIMTMQTVYWTESQSPGAFYIGQIVVILGTLIFALSLLALTMSTFNRCLGRMPERPRRAPQPPRQIPAGSGPYVRPAGITA